MLPDSVSFIQESPVRVILTELRSGVPVKYRGGSHVNGLLTMCTVLMSPTSVASFRDFQLVAGIDGYPEHFPRS